jgi:hypothetical protein
MVHAHALVLNLSSSANVLDFGEFTLRLIDASNHQKAKDSFQTDDMLEGDWAFTKKYSDESAGLLTDGIPQKIPQDVEDILFLLRMYKVGDISFYRQIFRPADGTVLVQSPYSFMNSLNRNSAFTSEFEPEECQRYIEYANGIRSAQSWTASWFNIARNYFMHGSSKEYLPQYPEVERIVNYGTALEATLTPEQDFTKNRFSNRASRLIAENDENPKKTIERMKELYNMRSTIVHGRALTQEQIDWLTDNAYEIELSVRHVLSLGVQKIPPDEDGRVRYLSDLYDVEDTKRGNAAWDAFCQIDTETVREDTIKKIAKKMKWECQPKIPKGSKAEGS